MPFRRLRVPKPTLKRPLRSLRLGLGLLVCGAGAAPAVEVAGELLISLDARDFSTGDETWGQASAVTGIPGDFVAHGAPVVRQVGGARAVVFDGVRDHFRGPSTTEALHAPGAAHSVELWVCQGDVRDQESVVSWSRRWGGAGDFAGFRYGAHPEFGAVGRWGSADMGFSKIPETGRWHHLVYTYDGRTQSIYVDGVLDAKRQLGLIDAHDSLPILLGVEQREDFSLEGSFCRYSGALGRLRIHAGSLTAAQVKRNHEEERAAFPGSRVAPLASAPRHRYRFAGDPGEAADGSEIPDEVGGWDAVVRGDGAHFDAEGLRLPGGSSSSAPYVDLPNGIISAMADEVSIEFWATQYEATSWARLMSVGSTTVGEVGDPGGEFYGGQVITLATNVGLVPVYRLIRASGKLPDGKILRETSDYPATELGREFHHVLMYDSKVRHWFWYRDGALMECLPDPKGPSSIPDVNAWLGRSEFSDDQNLNGRFNELRIYDYALSEAEVWGSFRAGPDRLRVASSGGASDAEGEVAE